MKKTAIVYELLPAKPQRELFCQIIRILRKEFRAANFEPHLTLFVATRKQRSPKKILQEFRARPIRLKVRGVAFSAKFTKTLFVRFESSPALKRLIVDLGRAAGLSAKAPTDPHVSLVYQKIPRRLKKELAKVIKFPFRSVRFDSIAAVRLTLPVRNGSDVTKWRMVAKKRLSR
jgi:2'-5' RNA ligase